SCCIFDYPRERALGARGRRQRQKTCQGEDRPPHTASRHACSSIAVTSLADRSDFVLLPPRLQRCTTKIYPKSGVNRPKTTVDAHFYGTLDLWSRKLTGLSRSRRTRDGVNITKMLRSVEGSRLRHAIGTMLLV